MKRISLLIISIIFGLGQFSGAWTLAQTARAATADAKTYQFLNLFGDVFEQVRAEYVEEPEDRELIEKAIKGMVTSLDPHSDYLTQRELDEMQTDMRGNFGGLGIELVMENGVVRVISPIDDTPAARAGIIAGDLITHLDGEPIKGLTHEEAIDKMRGTPGSPIMLTVLRKGEKAPLEIRVVRAIIRLKATKHRLEDDIGYIRVKSFTEQTFANLEAAVLELIGGENESRIKGIIVDLRNNPGGLLNQAVNVSDAFLDRGEIVSTRGRKEAETRRWNAKSGDLSKGLPIVVLINAGSASASEIVAGALQDHKRATIVGTQSFGKGSVQTIIPLSAGNGGLRLTTALYYTPSGRTIQARGIEPDIIVRQKKVPELFQRRAGNGGEQSLRGHLPNAAEINAADDTADEVQPDGAGSGDAGASGDGTDSENGDDEAVYADYVPQDPKDDAQLIYALRLLRGEQVHEKFIGAQAPSKN